MLLYSALGIRRTRHRPTLWKLFDQEETQKRKQTWWGSGGALSGPQQRHVIAHGSRDNRARLEAAYTFSMDETGRAGGTRTLTRAIFSVGQESQGWSQKARSVLI